MEKSSQNPCTCKGREYADSERTCDSNACFICRNGTWEKDNRIFVL